MTNILDRVNEAIETATPHKMDDTAKELMRAINGNKTQHLLLLPLLTLATKMQDTLPEKARTAAACVAFYGKAQPELREGALTVLKTIATTEILKETKESWNIAWHAATDMARLSEGVEETATQRREQSVSIMFDIVAKSAAHGQPTLAHGAMMDAEKYASPAQQTMAADMKTWLANPVGIAPSEASRLLAAFSEKHGLKTAAPPEEKRVVVKPAPVPFFSWGRAI